MSDTSKERTYGNWSLPRVPGLGPFSFFTTIFIFITSVITILILTFSFLWGLISCFISFIIITLTLKLPSGFTIIEYLIIRTMWLYSLKNGYNYYVSGLFTTLPIMSKSLPSIGSNIKVINTKTKNEKIPFSILYHSKRNHYTVVLECSTANNDLIDNNVLDNYVAYWSQWLTRLSHERYLVGASVVVENSLDNGKDLEDNHNFILQQNDNPNELIKNSFGQFEKDYKANPAYNTNIYITLTYSGVYGNYSASRRMRNTIDLLESNIQNVLNDVPSSGVNSVKLLQEWDIAKIVKLAYDPGAQDTIDELNQRSRTRSFKLDDSGPIAHEEKWDHYLHDAYVSSTWCMVNPPKGVIYADTLSKLLKPYEEFVKKRVTILYRPYSIKESSKIVERERRNVLFKLNQQKSSKDIKNLIDLKTAEQSNVEEIRGSTIIRFSILLTVTTDRHKNYKELKSIIDSLTPESRIEFGQAYASQSAAFIASLPLGIVLPYYNNTFMNTISRYV